MKTRWIILIFFLCSAATFIFAVTQTRDSTSSHPAESHIRTPEGIPLRGVAAIASPNQTKHSQSEGNTSDRFSEELRQLKRAELDRIYPGAETIGAPEIVEIQPEGTPIDNRSASQKPIGFIRDVLVRGDNNFPAIAARQWLTADGKVRRQSLVVADEVLVKIRDGKTLGDLAQIADPLQMSVATGIQDNGLVLLKFKTVSPTEFQQKIAALSRESSVIELAIPNGITKAR